MGNSIAIPQKAYVIIMQVMIYLVAHSCLEPFEPVTEVFESALIIEATLTNEEKEQVISLSRTFRLEADGPNPETGADVMVLDDAGMQYAFKEEAAGRYVSVVPFSAVADRIYTLEISTLDGRAYGSEPTRLTPVAQIENLYASRETNERNEDGMALLVDAAASNSDARYYRYDYEETYKVIAPRWFAVDAVVIKDRPPPAIVILQPKKEEQRVCYATVASNTITIADAQSFGGEVKRFPVRFIRSDNYILSHRYSILVRQYAQSRDAFKYYETLKDFSSESESLFAQTQPGFYNGNVFSVASRDEKVLGFFEVSSVSSRRIYFNYEDFYPEEPLPPYQSDCSLEFNPDLLPNSPGGASPLVQAVNNLRQKYVDAGPSDLSPYVLVTRACGDCRALGSNVVPDFWIE